MSVNSKENTNPYPAFDAGAMRKMAEKLAHSEEGNTEFDGTLEKLDKQEGPLKGGC